MSPPASSIPNNSRSHSRKMTSPEGFFGHQMGADRKIARWDKIVEYFYLLETESDDIKVVDMGRTTEGNPFLLVVISAKKNLDRLDHYKAVNQKITDPRGIPEEEIKELVKEGKSVVCQSGSLHANEISGAQMAPELAYDLLACDSPENRKILEEVIFLLVPSFNPDGQIKVTDWYNKTLGTEYEASGLPWLYHKYAGHDNNRDGFTLNLVESQYMGKVLFTEWRPHVYQDHHQMGTTGPRFYISPYCDPMRPYADPLMWRELSWYGAHMAYTLEEHGKTGVINAAQYPAWAGGGHNWMAYLHNVTSMISESASARLATPVYVHPHQLRGASRKNMPEYEAQTHFPHPWPGGWWRLRDLVEQQKIASWALLDICANFREKVLWNAYLKAQRQTERGAADETFAYVISPRQNDPLTALKLVDLMLRQGVEVKKARKTFLVEDRLFPAGTYVITLDQPKMGVIKSMLGRIIFPDNYWSRNPDGSPTIYDTATDTIGEFMGVDVKAIGARFSCDLEVVTSVEKPGPRPLTAPAAPAGYLLDSRFNDSFIAVNRLLAKGARIFRLESPVSGCAVKTDSQGACHVSPASSCTGAHTSEGPAAHAPKAGCFAAWTQPLLQSGFAPGSFLVEGSEDSEGLADLLESISIDLGLAFHPVLNLTALEGIPRREVKHLRIGMYQRYMGGNMDEGWTRLVLDNFEFPYVSLKPADFKNGKLKDKVDVIVFPSDRPQSILGPDGSRDPRMQRWMSSVPPEYRGGLGKEGAQAVKEFVESGGRVVAIESAWEFAAEACGLNVRNVLANLTWQDYFCPGTTLRVKFDSSHPLAWGMPEEGLLLNNRGAAFEVTDRSQAENYEVVAEYPERDLMQSGWLVGEDNLAKKPCMLKVKCKDGEVVLFGFRPQFRAQTHGTFKLLFNCLV